MTDRAEVKILPPFILASAIALDALFAYFIPMRALPGAVAAFFGVAVITMSVLLVIWAAKEIADAHTAFDARKPTTLIVTTGVYRFTRNPVYLSMIMLVIGIGLFLNSPWAILVAIPTGGVLYLTAIKPEEHYLEGKFAGAYRAYCDTVPRWLSRRRLTLVLLGRPEA